jgi:lipopolysaccharide export system permease protein
LHLEGDRLWLDLTSSTLHGYHKEDPSRYRTNFNQTQRILIAGAIGSHEADTSYEKPARSQSIRELLQSARKAEKKSTQTFREAWVEIHKKIAIPLACIVFAILGIPLAERRRGGQGADSPSARNPGDPLRSFRAAKRGRKGTLSPVWPCGSPT